MGKKKSVVLMVLLTIVIVVLCAITAFPVFTIPGSNGVKKWNPVVLQYDLGTDLGGGYYAYYYPEGVISETQYNDDLSALKAAVDAAETDVERTKAEQEKEDYVDSYTAVEGVNGLYFSTDEKLNLVDKNGALTNDFKTAFSSSVSEISSRFAKKGYSSHRVAVVNGYALRVELPSSESWDMINTALTYFVYTGKVTIEKGGEVVDELKDGGDINSIIKSVSIATRYKQSYLNIKFTSAGKAMLNRVKGGLSTTTEAQSGSATTLDIKVGDQVIASLYKDMITDSNEGRTLFVEEEYKEYLNIVKILLDSAMENGGYDVTFKGDSVRSFEPVYGENALTLLYIAIAIVLVAMLVVPVLKMGRFGIVNGYATLSYFLVTAICFAFISGGAFEITLGSVLVFLIGLVLVNVLQFYIYNAIKAEFNLGKTVESSVKGGYRKTLWNVVDIYAVLLLGALAFLLGAANLHTVALQAIICVVTGAFCNLLWARAINFMLLSASKNKFKYFRFVREDDDDE